MHSKKDLAKRNPFIPKVKTEIFFDDQNFAFIDA